MRRREFLGLAALPLAQALNRQPIGASHGSVIGADGAIAAGVDLVRDWTGAFCRSRIVNRTSHAVPIKEVVLFDVDLSMPPETALYGEGFQMLTQTGGTLGAPVDFSQYTDAKHYRIPEADGARAFYGLLTVTPPGQDTTLLAFTSCARFSGRFVLRAAAAPPRLAAVIDAEGLELGRGETWALEELMVKSGPRARLLDELGGRMRVHHPPLAWLGSTQWRQVPPTGWCSWYCFGPRVTAQQVLDTLDVIAKNFPGLKYVQIDDGYQSAMGDWLATGSAFGGNVRTVLSEIRRRGFEPAIWVAPFVAEENSEVFRQHRDWFVKDDEAEPLRSDRVTFGGWRRGPWYVVS